ncbi:tRNA (N6-threonylcarbamoyladenosine(37)-N6)-methyltransferase TrmO [Halomonas sp. ML-15]|uniref:tRNA (N6-threonylcarbamoyladenosine(37)-N6)-methyltransferase TrmO n=1 Tax=Halomonas sp. ML-15 TaxID=2773305 RepID=UPI001745D42B|nr:tRNA (N6-threonylcarbamoyladenosine(37)-N6)-methyltransferase TrmO [Halomonas sp. ML-15]MBD3894753.1 tRNA (N6-threonylcarbamoyladenosine(37)-N6)-methyltransferase TrmO [Halomonas sp. ML-15]
MDAPAASYRLEAIGHIESDFPDKFGVPRQPGLAPAARARLVLHGDYADPLAVRGLDAYSHVWLTFVFHHSPERWTPLVRPPRLGGNAKLGVFATRSTHRPNRLGLSLAALGNIDTRHGVALELHGCDLVDGTPVLDIKPYLPWVEALPDARARVAPAAPPRYAVRFSPEAEAALERYSGSGSLRALIEQVLAQDPRPAYHRDKGDAERLYGVRLRELDVRFRAEGEGFRVVEIIPT